MVLLPPPGHPDYEGLKANIGIVAAVYRGRLVYTCYLYVYASYLYIPCMSRLLFLLVESAYYPIQQFFEVQPTQLPQVIIVDMTYPETMRRYVYYPTMVYDCASVFASFKRVAFTPAAEGEAWEPSITDLKREIDRQQGEGYSVYKLITFFDSYTRGLVSPTRKSDLEPAGESGPYMSGIVNTLTGISFPTRYITYFLAIYILC